MNITVFEKSPRIGGRTLTVNPLDNPLGPVELGASIFVEANSILYSAVDEFSLTFANPGDVDGEIVVWDGEKIRYQHSTSSWQWWSYAKLFWKYGLAPYKTQKLVHSIVTRFLDLYKAPHFPFQSLTQRAEELELIKLTGMTGSQFLDESGVSSHYMHPCIHTHIFTDVLCLIDHSEICTGYYPVFH